jgi:hypothetical protein
MMKEEQEGAVGAAAATDHNINDMRDEDFNDEDKQNENGQTRYREM